MSRHQQGTPDEGLRLAFAARDGEPLVGRLFTSEGPLAATLIAPATGVPARFYRSFARALTQASITAFVFDYRGIGESLRGHVKDSDARKQDWGQLDMPAALDELARRAPGVPLTLVGHSAGGQLVGLMDNVARLERIVQVASSSGYMGAMGWRYRVLGRLLLCAYGSLSVRALGYGATRWVGWGEDLPSGVLRQWAEWCSTPGYLESSFGDSIEQHWFDEIRCPLLNLSAEDDPIATQANVSDILRLFPNAGIERRRLDPHGAGVGKIGHIDFFRSRCAPLWPLAQDFLVAR